MKRFTLEKTCPIKLMVYDDAASRLEIRDYVFTFSLMTDPTEYNDVIEAQIDQNISFTRIMFLLDIIVNESILYSADAIVPVSEKIYSKINNNLLLTPDVSEGTLLALLHMKLNHICQKNSMVEKVKLMDVQDNINYELTCDDEDLEDLPSVREWSTEFSHWSTPWWTRNDAYTWDIDFGTANDLEQFRETFEIPEIMTDFNNIPDRVRSIFTEHLVEKGLIEKTEKGTVIEIDFADNERRKWTPTVV